MEKDGSPHLLYELEAINGRSWPATEHLAFKHGSTVRYRVVNGALEPHAMHLHGLRILELCLERGYKGRNISARHAAASLQPFTRHSLRDGEPAQDGRRAGRRRHGVAQTRHRHRLRRPRRPTRSPCSIGVALQRVGRQLDRRRARRRLFATTRDELAGSPASNRRSDPALTWLQELQYSVVMKTTGRKPLRRRFVGVRDAKAQLSRLLQDVQDGEEWTITERGKPVARLVPIARGTMSFAQRLARLEENGTIEPAHADVLPLPPPLPLQSGLAQKMLERDRDSLA